MMAMKKFKNTAVTLLAGLGVLGGANAALYQEVSTSVEQISSLSSTQGRSVDVFSAVNRLVASMQKMNLTVKAKLKRIDQDEFEHLLFIKQSLDLGFYILTQRYEDEIYTQFTAEFRAFSAARTQFKMYLRQVQERLYGVEIAQLDDISLTEQDVREMNQAVNRQYGVS
ncbi:hypothetical protein FHQ28_07880 [Pasteurellaceae bacterium USgator11]|nr:hypothetical protein FHQ19_03605 [Pasteurellaceae bacterium UScroc12]TNG97499.1 hypothetical protein FHQ20_02865 [Pasteurellaceae bacterium USgator41]TNG99401.1 hypothetical protein FHQ24_05975 [Pasteurellaceae bacterium UScroc31]TNH00490.1 hypothetical protein FHQ28_07880 [Pasteurellaceae bacterium USgator11]